ncbi:MAG: hypothetical protein NWR72_09165 [Bacteroidia bacterium]|nr:hypothetical protein [Bacteroidia bacterium]
MKNNWLFISALALLCTIGTHPDLVAQSSRYSQGRSRGLPPGGTVSVAAKTIPRSGFGKTVTTGAGTPGDIIVYEFDRVNQIYRAENLTNGARLGGEFETFKNPDSRVNSDIYHIESGGSHYYGVELTNKFVATNFPAGTDKVSIFSGINSQVNNYANFQNFDGAYLVFHLYLEEDAGSYDYDGGMSWGVAVMSGEDPQNYEGYFLMKLYNTNDYLPSDVNLEEELGILGAAIEGTAADEDLEDGELLLGYYGINPDAPETFNTFFVNMEDAQSAGSDDEVMHMGEYFAAMGYANLQESVMIIDLGEGNGYLQMVRITDENGYENDRDPQGSYLYVQSDVDFGSGGGFFDVYYDDQTDNFTLDIEHYSEHIETEEDIEVSEDLLLQQGGIGSVWFTDFDYYDEDFENDGGERLYIIINHDFVMHFTIDLSDNSLLNYGVGAGSND